MPIPTSALRRPTVAATILCGLLALCGCKQKPAIDNAANAAAAPVTLPPAISKSATYRCKDNSLIYVDFFADDLSVNLRTSQDGPINRLTAQTPGGPFSADGYVLSGSGKKVDVTTPDKAVQACTS